MEKEEAETVNALASLSVRVVQQQQEQQNGGGTGTTASVNSVVKDE